MIARTRLSRHPHPLFSSVQDGSFVNTSPGAKPSGSPVDPPASPPPHVDRLLAPDDEPNLHTREDGQASSQSSLQAPSPPDDTSIHTYFLEAVAERQGAASPTCVLINRYSPREVSLSPSPPVMSAMEALRRRCSELEEENARLRLQLARRDAPTPSSSPIILSDLLRTTIALKQRREAPTPCVDPSDL